MVRLIVYFLVCSLPALLLGSLLVKIFPHLYRAALIIINLVIITGLFLWYRSRQLQKYTALNQLNTMPGWLRSRGFFVLLIVFMVITSFFVYYDNRTALFIDNATANEIKLEMQHEGTYTIGANQYKELFVPAGEVVFVYANKKRSFNIPEKGKWVFNIDAQGWYYKTSVLYRGSKHLTGVQDTYEDRTGGKEQIINKEFFNAACDFVFEAPESITVKQRIFERKNVNKSVLYRISKEEAAELLGAGSDQNKEEP